MCFVLHIRLARVGVRSGRFYLETVAVLKHLPLLKLESTLALYIRLTTYYILEESYPVLFKDGDLIHQSSMFCQDREEGNVDDERIVHFKDGAAGYTCAVSSQPDPTTTYGVNEESDYRSWLARPVVFNSSHWDIGTDFSTNLKVWDFFKLPRVANRINNFKGFRAKLHVKILLNGGPFYHGRLLAYYKPLEADLTTWGSVEDYNDNTASDLVRNSQLPHIHLDSTDSLGGTFELPFFAPRTGTDFLTADFGEITIRSINSLEHANGAVAPDGVTITTMVWATDVQVIGPTSSNIAGLQAQSGKGTYDEYEKDGVVSKPATVIASIADRLATAPVIGAYARATSIVATAGAAVARMFGFSRPIQTSDYAVVVPEYGGNLAVCNTTDYTPSTAVDVKNEVVIDPRTTGLSGVDELDISSIAAKESYLGSYDWTHTLQPGDNIMAIPCNPGKMYLFEGNLDNGYIQPTSVCWLSQMFRYYTGSLTFRFMVASSSVHKGRLLVRWDAEGFTAPFSDLSAAQTRVVDIAHERDFTFTVHWGVTTPWLECDRVTPTGNPIQTLVSTGTQVSDGTDNGMLEVAVFNQLTSPSTDDSAVQINLFVSSSDLRLRDPDLNPALEPFGLPSVFVPQSGQASYAAVEEENPTSGEPNAPAEDEFNAGGSMLPLDAIHFGESIPSLRLLLKRYVTVADFTLSTEQVDGSVEMTFTDIPMVPWNRSNPNYALAAGYDGRRNFIAFIRSAFYGMRGSMRHKLFALSDSSLQHRQIHALTREFDVVPPNGVTNKYQSNSFSMDSLSIPGWGDSGVVIQPTEDQFIASCSLPYQNKFKFSCARDNSGRGQLQSLRYWRTMQSDGFKTENALMRHMVAAGEDFNLFFYGGPPRLHVFV